MLVESPEGVGLPERVGSPEGVDCPEGVGSPGLGGHWMLSALKCDPTQKADE